MANLIVDFPCEHFDPCTNDDQGGRRLSVEFAETSEVVVVDRHSPSDAHNVWYSELDLDAMKSAHKRDVRDVHKRLHLLSLIDDDDSASSAQMEEELMDGMELFGIENLISSKLIRKKLSVRSQYSRAILEEQSRQNGSKVYDPCRLARVAHENSRWAVNRGHAVGLLQLRHCS